jgi:hypothetical protein
MNHPGQFNWTCANEREREFSLVSLREPHDSQEVVMNRSKVARSRACARSKLAVTGPRAVSVPVKRRPNVLLPFAMLLVLCACEARSRSDDPIPECAAYASSARTCLGSRVAERLLASFAKAPENPTARAALRDRCLVETERIRGSCR